MGEPGGRGGAGGGGEVDKPGEGLNAEHRACELAVRSALGHAISCGELLIEAKEAAGYGRWLAWLAESFEGSEDTAQVYVSRETRRRHQ